MEIVIFRHGQTDWNVEGRLQGSTDVPLNATGETQALELAKRLSIFKFDLIISSDLIRAHATAKAVAHGRDIPLITDQRLRELGLGDAEGKTRAEIEAKWGIEDFAKYNFPGRETASSVAERVNQVIDELMAKNIKSVAISSHGGVVWNWLAQVTTRDDVGKIGNTDAFHLRMENGKAIYLGRISNNKN